MSGNSRETLMLAERLQAVRDRERFDAVVAGGGASGLMACLAAARRGARVLVVESSGCFGGAATTSMVAQWLGFHNGETRAVGGLPIEYAERIAARGGTLGFENYVLAEASAQPMHLKRLPFNPEIVKLVSDELVLECEVSRVEEAKSILQQCMVNACRMVLKKVAIETPKVVVSDHWAKE